MANDLQRTHDSPASPPSAGAAERIRRCEELWQRGAPDDLRAIDALLAGAPEDALPEFMKGPSGARLLCAPPPEDAAAAAALLEGAYWIDGLSAAELSAAHLGSQAWVAGRDAGGALVGSARAISDGARVAWIYDVIVTPAWRGRGLGIALVRLLLAHPAVRGARKVLLGTRDAQGLYRKLGFVEESELPPRAFASTTMLLVRPRPA